MEGDGITLFNPSSLQHLAPDDDDRENEEEDRRQIEQKIDERLEEMSGEELNLDDDDDDSMIGSQFRHKNIGANHLDHENQRFSRQPSPYTQSPIYGSGGLPLASGGRVNFSNEDERRYLTSSNDQSQENLETLYNARGVEIKRLTANLSELSQNRDVEFRKLNHEVTLLKAEKGRLQASLEHYESVAQNQSEENRELKREIENLASRLDSADETKRELMSQLESSDLLVKTIQGQLSDLQKSETILKAKQHHEQVVRSLKERHETETYNLQQENERLNLKLKQMENEVESVRGKCFKIQRDHELLMIEKSETIKMLQERLEASQRQLAQHISETSSQGYVNIKAMHEKFKQDQERYANDLLTFQAEIDHLKDTVKRKDDELSILKRTLTKTKQEQEEILNQKCEMIQSLQIRLNESEHRLNQLITESNKSNGLQADKLKQDVRKLTADLEKCHLEIQDRETEIASLISKLAESMEKYQILKKKVRQYQAHCKTKEVKYSERLRSTEDEFKQKLLNLKQEVEVGFTTKEKQVEREVLSMKQFFDDELNKLMRIGTETDPPFRLTPDPRSADDQSENLRPPMKQATKPQPGLCPSPASTASKQELDRLLKTATFDLRDQLKMPDERFPLSQLNNN